MERHAWVRYAERLDAPFWSEPEQPWTSVRVWDRREDVGADHALREA